MNTSKGSPQLLLIVSYWGIHPPPFSWESQVEIDLNLMGSSAIAFSNCKFKMTLL